jgi:hypothetical protein
MGRPLNIRQQALATAQVYVRRFYLKVEMRRTNPALVLATALYLACKMEECPQHIRMIMAEARHCWGMCLLLFPFSLRPLEHAQLTFLNSGPGVRAQGHLLIATCTKLDTMWK